MRVSGEQFEQVCEEGVDRVQEELEKHQLKKP